jgi:hypothetical protein
LIKYNDNLDTIAEQLTNLVTRRIGYIQFNWQEMSNIFWVVVFSVMKTEAKVPDKMGLHK